LLYKFEGRKRISEKVKEMEPLVGDFDEEEGDDEASEILSEEETKKIQKELDQEFGVKQENQTKIDVFNQNVPKVRFSDVVESLDSDEVRKVEKIDPIKNDIENETGVEQENLNEQEILKTEHPSTEEPKITPEMVEELDKILEDEETFHQVLKTQHDESKVDFFYEKFPQFSREELKQVLELEINPEDRYSKLLQNALDDTEKTLLEALNTVENEKETK
jgi:F0F1-type ATP synthase delta subunit